MIEAWPFPPGLAKGLRPFTGSHTGLIREGGRTECTPHPEEETI